MPAALERKLKRQVAGKKISKERKDAYVYGTLRKTGWKPKREKTMSDNSKIIRLHKVSSDLDTVINFQDDEKYKPRILQRALLGPEITIGIHGKKGERLGGAGEAYVRRGWESLKGSAIGIGAGGGVGAGVGALTALKRRKVPGFLKERTLQGALLGASTGSAVGAIGGAYKGIFGKKGEEIYRRRTGQDNLSAFFDRLIEFQYDDDDEQRRGGVARAGAKIGVGAGIGAAGLYGVGKTAPVSVGGQGLSPMGALHDLGHGVRGIGSGGASAIGRNIAQGAGVVGNLGRRAGSHAMDVLRKIRFSDSSGEIRFASDDDHRYRRAGIGGVLGAGAVGAGYLAHRNVMANYGTVETLPGYAGAGSGFQNTRTWGKIRNPSATGPAKVGAGQAYKSAVSDISQQIANRASKGARAAKFTYRRYTGIPLKQKGYAAGKAIISGLRHLNSHLDNVINFGTD